MNLFETWGIDMEYVILGLLVFNLIIFTILIVVLIKQSKLKKKYKLFMGGENAKTLEEQFILRFKEVDSLKVDNRKIINKLDIISENLLATYQKMGIVKYDAFKEMGGKLSFALVLLNDKNDGFVINSMHSSREGCYSYIKEIINGESYVVLAEEERLALTEAMKKSI